jgi:hypothetical protein
MYGAFISRVARSAALVCVSFSMTGTQIVMFSEHTSARASRPAIPPRVSISTPTKVLNRLPHERQGIARTKDFETVAGAPGNKRGEQRPCT